MLTEAIPQQIWRTDATGRIEYCNHHLCDYTGLSLEELQGEDFFKIIHPEDELLFHQGWQSVLAAGGSLETEVRVRGADANFRWFLIRSIPQHTKEGQIACWYGIHIDIEDQYQAQQKLLLAQENLTRLSRTSSMAELAASIAHELNQPLTAVVTNAYACREWLNRNPANLEKAATTAEKMIQESTRASAVVRRVRALFRHDAQERELVDINKLIRELVRLLRDEAIRRNVSIRLQLSDSLPIIPLDAVQIQQVLVNLAINGMDAMVSNAGPRELTIRSEAQGDKEILVSVQDRGPGVDPGIMNKIFDPFYSTKPHGTGMGLTICRSIIEEHDGRLSVTNSTDSGAIFQFTMRSRS
jgi:PAS domain S-box-containing protein